ncbi:MAG: DNA adenine methylase [Elusimicrobiota bacterium]|nr:DNA adenine methylase [Elusimicrobiota bacterium]
MGTLLLEKNVSNIKRATPFLKWAGGKGQLLKQIERLFPFAFNNYIEPFLGGGAVFFYLYSTGRLNDKKITLIDSNEELINCYFAIKKDVNKLIKILCGEKFANTEEVFYEIRIEEPRDMFERAARAIYLNKTCYNGLYRVNSSGKFNVPFGRYRNPLICDVENLKMVNTALRNVKIVLGDFEKCLEYAQPHGFIYFDPPYQPISKTSSFTGYTKDLFDEKEQERLANLVGELNRKKCKIMLSNSDSPFIEGLYKDYRIEYVKARRSINCNGFNRGEINELVVMNY